MRILVALMMLFSLGVVPANAAPGDVKLVCPITANPSQGQTVVCTYQVEATSTPPPTTTTTTTTTVPTTTTTTTAPPVTTTTTAPPPSGMKGWQLTSSNVGLAPFGLKCETLPLYIGPAKPLPGNTISGYRIEVPLDLSAGDILIEKSCIKPNGVGSHNEYLTTTTTCVGNNCSATVNGNVTIQDSEITAEHLPAATIAGADAFIGVGTLKRNYIHGMGSGISFFETGTVHNALAENNYVRGLRSYGDSHNDGATVRDFRKNTANTRTAKFIGNRIDCSTGRDTGALFIQPTWVSIYNVHITDNYLEGGGYNLYAENSGGVYGNIRATNNRFRPTGWGAAATPSGPGWAVWTANHIYDATKLDGKGAVVNP